MYFSVLLPTRNGGKFLENCIRSILEQPFADMELIVSDNANADETPAIIARFQSDSRLKYLRLDTQVPVTENWNHALSASRGEYILTVGDDDFLLPDYFSRVSRVIQEYGQPDCVVYNGYSFVFPGSIRGNQRSYYAEPHFEFGPEFVEGFLSKELRNSIVRDMFRFSVRFPLNIQLTVVSRHAARRIKGGMFQPPFPDHYALAGLLLESDTFVYFPKKLVIIGVSPKSFGHYVYSHSPNQGMRYLDPHAPRESHFQGYLPGNELINQMCVWLVRLKANYNNQLGDIEISRPEYLRRQLFALFLQARFKSTPLREVVGHVAELSANDWISVLRSFLDPTALRAAKRAFRPGQLDEVRAQWPRLRELDGVDDIRQFALLRCLV